MKLATAPVHEGRSYYAIRKCKHLKGPAIFTTREDCSAYLLDRKEDKEKRATADSAVCDYKLCRTLNEAVAFIEPATVALAFTKLLKTPRRAVAAAASTPAPVVVAAAAAAAAARASIPPAARVPNNTPDPPAARTRTAALPITAATAATPAAPTAAVRRATASTKVSAPALVSAASSTAVSAPTTATAATAVLAPTTGNAAVTMLAAVATDMTTANSISAPPTAAAPSQPKRKCTEGNDKPRPAKRSKLKMTREERFEMNFALLKEYKELHGTCDVPKNHPTIVNTKFFPIGRWILDMRKQIKLADEGKSYLDKEHIQRLLDLGFCMQPCRGVLDIQKRQLQQAVEQFDKMLPQLKAFQQKHGHCNVPDHDYEDCGDGTRKKSKKRSPLRVWIMRLRDDYVRMKQGKETVLTAERMAQLSGLGFDLAPARRRTFEERAYEWLEYRTKHGQEPRRETDAEPLAVWATKVRAKYEAKQAGKSSAITDEQIALLNKWGFRWQTDSKFAAKSVGEMKKWEERLEDLVRYKEEHGDCLVPQSTPGLGQWVKRQRKHWQAFIAGKPKPQITQERIDKLTSIGFVFKVRQSSVSRLRAQNMSQGLPARPPSPETSSSDEEGQEEVPLSQQDDGRNNLPPPLHHYATMAINQYMQSRTHL